jgi:hypothetical protein
MNPTVGLPIQDYTLRPSAYYKCVSSVSRWFVVGNVYEVLWTEEGNLGIADETGEVMVETSSTFLPMYEDSVLAMIDVDNLLCDCCEDHLGELHDQPDVDMSEDEEEDEFGDEFWDGLEDEYGYEELMRANKMQEMMEEIFDAQEYARPLGDFVPISASTEALVASREETHGWFTDTSYVAQSLKSVLFGDDSLATDLTPLQREGLDMICSKISRIMAGDPNFKDHWDDIAGYAKMVADQL